MADADVTALVGAARNGDADAYLALVAPLRADAVRLATAITGSRADADDVLQDALIKAHATLGRFRTDAPFRPWLLRIVANEAKNRRRSASRRAAATARFAQRAGLTPPAPGPETTVLDAMDHQALWRAVAVLNQRDREVIAYRYFADMNEAETAEALRCRPGTVKSRLSRALGRLRAALDEDERGGDG